MAKDNTMSRIMPRIAAVVLALALVAGLGSAGIAPSKASASPGLLEWTEVNIPEPGRAGDYVIFTDSDVGPIAMSPNGDTHFAAVSMEPTAIVVHVTDDVEGGDLVVDITYTDQDDNTGNTVEVTVPEDTEMCTIIEVDLAPDTGVLDIEDIAVDAGASDATDGEIEVLGYGAGVVMGTYDLTEEDVGTFTDGLRAYNNYLFRSTDDGYSWANPMAKIRDQDCTAFAEYVWASDFHTGQNLDQDFSPIVDIVVAPDWEDTDTVYVTTKYFVYISRDRGVTWDMLEAVPGTVGDDDTDTITSMDVALDENDSLVVAVGTWWSDEERVVAWDTTNGPAVTEVIDPWCVAGGPSDPDVYRYTTFWDERNIEDQIADWGDGDVNVLDVALLNYAAEEVITAVGCDADGLGFTALATQLSDNDFGDNRGIVYFKDQDGIDLNNTYRASIGAGSDYASSVLGGLNSVYVGICSNDPADFDLWPFLGDVYKATPSNAGFATNAVDLNVGGAVGTNYTETNIWQIAVSGTTNAASIIAGTEVLDLIGIGGYQAATVHYTDDSGALWYPSSKRPTGSEWGLTSLYGTDVMGFGLVEAYVIQGSGAYCGTRGVDSAFSATGLTPLGYYWNQRGLVDVQGDQVVSYSDASPSYSSDQTLFFVGQGSDEGAVIDASLWQTADGGSRWERTYSYSLSGAPGLGEPFLYFDGVEVADGWPGDPGILLFPWNQPDTTTMIESDNGGTTFMWRIAGPADANRIMSLEMLSYTSMLLGDNNGVLWRTDNMGDSWQKPDDSEIPGAVAVTSIEVGSDILVGTDEGKVYLSDDDGVTVEQVGPSIPGAQGSWLLVDLDTDYDVNEIVYAGVFSGGGRYLDDIDGTGAVDDGTGNVWRFDIEASSVWDEILDPSDVDVDFSEIDVTGLVCATDGTLYVTGWWADAGQHTGGIFRTVNPTELERGDIFWEIMDQRLPHQGQDLFPWQTQAVEGSNILVMPVWDNDALVSLLLIFEDTLSAKVTLVSPADGSSAGTIIEAQDLARVVLSWEDITSADWYEYEIALDGDFTTVIAASSGATEGTVQSINLWPGTTFFWRVRVIDPLASAWSDGWSFTTSLGPGVARPTLESPAAGAINVSRQPVFEWSGLVDTINYEFQVATDSDFESGDLVPGLDKTGDNALGPYESYQCVVPLNWGQTYYWRVRAIGVGTQSPWSDVGTFTVMVEPVEEPPPGTPAWVWALIAIGTLLAGAVIAVIILMWRGRPGQPPARF